MKWWHDCELIFWLVLFVAVGKCRAFWLPSQVPHAGEAILEKMFSAFTFSKLNYHHVSWGKPQKIDNEYVHVAVKFRNWMIFKKDSWILDKLALEEAEVGGFKNCIHGFPHIVPYMTETLSIAVIFHVKNLLEFN